MCFSAEASFTAAVVLAAIGVCTLSHIKQRNYLLLGVMPLFFAAQQFIEGILWLILLKAGSAFYHYVLTQLYAGFVGVIWPILVPTAIGTLETGPIRRKILNFLWFLGMGVAVYTLYGIVAYGIESRIVDYCIQYRYPSYYPFKVRGYSEWIYILVVLVPFFLSSDQRLQKIGLVNLVTFFVAYYFYRETYVSVWCFFAAITSGLIYFYIPKEKSI